MRAKLPVKDGCVDRDGVKIHYEIYGNGAETIVFIPPWGGVESTRLCGPTKAGRLVKA